MIPMRESNPMDRRQSGIYATPRRTMSEGEQQPVPAPSRRVPLHEGSDQLGSYPSRSTPRDHRDMRRSYYSSSDDSRPSRRRPQLAAMYNHMHKMPPSEPIYMDIERRGADTSGRTLVADIVHAEPLVPPTSPYGNTSSLSHEFSKVRNAPPGNRENSSYDYPVMFSDPVESGSVLTGMSQQELLRRKAREDTKQRKEKKFGRKKKKERTSIVNLPMGLLGLGNKSNGPKESKTRAPPKAVERRRHPPMVDRMFEETEMSTAETTNTEGHDPPQIRGLTETRPVQTPRVAQRALHVSKVTDTHEDENSMGEFSFPLLSRDAAGGMVVEPERPVVVEKEIAMISTPTKRGVRFANRIEFSEPISARKGSNPRRIYSSEDFDEDSPTSAMDNRAYEGRLFGSDEPRPILRTPKYSSSAKYAPSGIDRYTGRSRGESAQIRHPEAPPDRRQFMGRTREESAQAEATTDRRQATQTVEVSSIQYQSIEPQVDSEVDSVISKPPPVDDKAFFNDNGRALSPIPAFQEFDQYEEHVAFQMEQEPTSHFVGHPAEKHALKMKKDSPENPKEVERLSQETRATHLTQMPTHLMPTRRMIELYPDPPLQLSADDESTVLSGRAAFIESVAAIVIQAAVRRHQAQCFVEYVRAHVEAQRREAEAMAIEMYDAEVRSQKESQNREAMVMEMHQGEQFDHIEAYSWEAEAMAMDFYNEQMNDQIEAHHRDTEGMAQAVYSGDVDGRLLTRHRSTDGARSDIDHGGSHGQMASRDVTHKALQSEGRHHEFTGRAAAEQFEPQAASKEIHSEDRHRHIQAPNDEAAHNREVEAMAMEMYVLAAIRIQSAFRGFWARDSVNVDHYCATTIQKEFRRYAARQRYHCDIWAIILVQSHWRRANAREKAANLLADVIGIQSVYRGYRVRKLMRQLGAYPRTKPRPQRAIPVFVKKQLPNGSPKSVTDWSGSRSSEAMSKKQMTQATPVASRQVRSRADPKHHRLQHSSATIIQARWRTWMCETQFIRELVDILIVQTIVRRWLARQKAQSLREIRDAERRSKSPPARKRHSEKAKVQQQNGYRENVLPVSSADKANVVKSATPPTQSIKGSPRQTPQSPSKGTSCQVSSEQLSPVAQNIQRFGQRGRWAPVSPPGAPRVESTTKASRSVDVESDSASLSTPARPIQNGSHAVWRGSEPAKGNHVQVTQAQTVQGSNDQVVPDLDGPTKAHQNGVRSKWEPASSTSQQVQPQPQERREVTPSPAAQVQLKPTPLKRPVPDPLPSDPMSPARLRPTGARKRWPPASRGDDEPAKSVAQEVPNVSSILDEASSSTRAALPRMGKGTTSATRPPPEAPDDEHEDDSLHQGVVNEASQADKSRATTSKTSAAPVRKYRPKWSAPPAPASTALKKSNVVWIPSSEDLNISSDTYTSADTDSDGQMKLLETVVVESDGNSLTGAAKKQTEGIPRRAQVVDTQPPTISQTKSADSGDFQIVAADPTPSTKTDKPNTSEIRVDESAPSGAASLLSMWKERERKTLGKTTS